MSATVIRVKRRIDEEPLTAFVLNCKKRRFEETIDADDVSTLTTNGAGDDASGHAKNPATAAVAAAAAQTTVVKFAGTVPNQDDIAKHIRKLTRADAVAATNHVRPVSASNSSSLRNRHAQHRQHVHEERFKIVNCFRTLDDPHAHHHADGEADDVGVTINSTGALDGIPSSERSDLTVVDIEKNPLSGDAAASLASSAPAIGQPSTSALASSATAAQPEYVYDLYVPDATVPNAHMDIFIEDLLSVEPLLESQLDNGELGASDSDDSEDSNNESNWRNDYPDTEEDDDDDEPNGTTAGGGADGDEDSVNEQDMRHAFDSLDIDAYLSSDDEEAVAVPANPFVYTIDQVAMPPTTTSKQAKGGSSPADHDSDVDEDDVERYGEAYARYKARILRRAHDKRDSSESSNDDDDSSRNERIDSSDECDNDD